MSEASVALKSIGVQLQDNNLNDIRKRPSDMSTFYGTALTRITVPVLAKLQTEEKDTYLPPAVIKHMDDKLFKPRQEKLGGIEIDEKALAADMKTAVAFITASRNFQRNLSGRTSDSKIIRMLSSTNLPFIAPPPKTANSRVIGMSDSTWRLILAAGYEVRHSAVFTSRLFDKVPFLGQIRANIIQLLSPYCSSQLIDETVIQRYSFPFILPTDFLDRPFRDISKEEHLIKEVNEDETISKKEKELDDTLMKFMKILKDSPAMYYTRNKMKVLDTRSYEIAKLLVEVRIS